MIKQMMSVYQVPANTSPQNRAGVLVDVADNDPQVSWLLACSGLRSTLKVFKACTGHWVPALVSLGLFYSHLAWIGAICQGERVNLRYLRASQSRKHCPNGWSEQGEPQGVQEAQTGAKGSEKESASLEQCEVEDRRTHGAEWGTIIWFLKPLPSEMYSVWI